MIRIFYKWSKQIKENKQFYYFFPYRFLMAADYWVTINLTLALFMSIPVINLFTHGTHITVAHAMGTTIGINTMIIIAAAFYFIKPTFNNSKWKRFGSITFWVVQATLLLFLISLIGMGIHRALWQAGLANESFSKMSSSSGNWVILFIIFGTLLFLSMGTFILYLFIKSWKKN